MKNNKTEQYNGFINTPNLWFDASVYKLNQFELPCNYYEILRSENFKEIRLGKRVEQFFEFQIEHTSEFKMIAKNLQIKDEKITIGELDALLFKNNKPLHVEIVYKFYLYNPKIETKNKLEKWIGPNRKDALVYKLSKLKEKQLPLLYSDFCKPVLKQFGLSANKIEQQVCYKAQLFLPFNSKEVDIAPLNAECIFGFYLSFSRLYELKDFQFYIPKKLDWLIVPHTKVDWFSYEEILPKIEAFINEKRSPMVWLKSVNSKFQKCFITFW